MFLGMDALRERLASDLRIHPLLEEDIGPGSIGLRAGTEFLISRARRPAEPEHLSREVGEEVLLRPREHAVVATHEFMTLPLDLVAFYFVRASWSSVGLAATPGLVSPGFAGRLAVSVYNAGPHAIRMIAGQSLLNLAIAELTGASSTIRYSGKLGYDGPDQADLDRLRDASAIPPAPFEETTAKRLQSMLDSALEAPPATKGSELEDFVAALFEANADFSVVGRNERLLAEEIDLLVRSQRSDGIWAQAGPLFIVECKNWQGSIGAARLRELRGVLDAQGPAMTMAVLCAPAGVTGTLGRDARQVIREAKQAGRWLVPLDADDLREAAAGVDLGEVIERKYTQVVVLS